MSETMDDQAPAARRRKSAKPPARPSPRAPAVLEHLEASKRMLAALGLETAELALAAAEGRPGGRESLAALHAKMTVTAFEIDCNAQAHDLALRLDREAATAWRAAVLALPVEQLIHGISAKACCTLCAADLCVLSGVGRCAHPNKGGLSPGLKSDARTRQVQFAASEKIRNEKGEQRNERTAAG